MISILMEVLPFAFARAYKRSPSPARVLFNLCADSADLRSRVLTRHRHRTPAIERYFLEQPAMLLSSMSALKRIGDSTRISRHVRKVLTRDSCAARQLGSLTRSLRPH